MDKEAEKKAHNQMNSVFRAVAAHLGTAGARIQGEGDFAFSATVALSYPVSDSPVQSVYFAQSYLPDDWRRTHHGTAFGNSLTKSLTRTEKTGLFGSRLAPDPELILYHVRMWGYGLNPDLPATQAESIRAIPSPKGSSLPSPIAGRVCLLKVTRFDCAKKPEPGALSNSLIPWTRKDNSGRKDHYCYLIIIEGKTLSPLEMLVRGTSP
jgi:hypothetical protein